MLKKILAIGGTISILCSGCASNAEKENASETSAEDQKEENHDATASSFQLYEPEIDYESNTVKIHDLVSNDLAGTITCRQDEQLVTALEVDDGFAVVKKSTDESGTAKEYENGGLVVTTDEDGSGSWTEYALELYDFDLNMVKSISLLDYIDQDKAEIHGDPVISRNAEKIAWLTDDSIYYIDLAAEKSCFVDALSQENIVSVQIAFAGNDKIGFYGSQGITETDTCYGFLNLEDQSVSAHIAKDYQAGTLLTNDRYVCINDAQDPYTNKSSGKIQILDCKTNEAREVQVDGLESTFSVITEDGKMLISIKWDEENSFRIRNYDMDTMDVLYETTCKKDEAVRPFEIKKAGDEYVVVYLSSEWGYVYAADH